VTKLALLPSLSHINTPNLTAFFQKTLRIKDVSTKDLFQELYIIRERNKPDIKIVQDIYFRLQIIFADREPEDCGFIS